MISKRAIGGPLGYNFLKHTLDILKLQMKSKKNVLGVFNDSLETYPRYSHEEQKKRVFVQGAMAFLVSLKGPFTKSLGNPRLKTTDLDS